MKFVLNRNNIKFKSKMKKKDLMELVRKHNLVTIVKNYYIDQRKTF